MKGANRRVGARRAVAVSVPLFREVLNHLRVHNKRPDPEPYDLGSWYRLERRLQGLFRRQVGGAR